MSSVATAVTGCRYGRSSCSNAAAGAHSLGSLAFFEHGLFASPRSDGASGRLTLEQLDAADATLMAESRADDVLGGGHVQDVSLESLAALVGLRGGYALVPALAHERLASMPEVALAKFKGQAPGRQIALYWREASPWESDLQAFAELLRKLARQRPGLKLIDAA